MNFGAERKVLITGANGLVGSAIGDLFCRSEIPFLAVSRRLPEKTLFWDSLTVDIEKDNLEKALERHDITTIIHCAAAIPNHIHDFKSCFEINTKIDGKMAEFIINRRISELVFISTTNLYGTRRENITEESAPIIENQYAQAKFNSEELFSSISNCRTFCLRINAPYHPTQKNETVLSRFIRQALNDENIKYHGTGARCQDFTHTQEIARAVLSCVDKKGESGVYNISAGQPINMKDLGEMIVSLLPNSKSKVLPSGAPDSQEFHRASFDLSKAKNNLGWENTIPLKQGVTDWINYLTR